MAQNNSFSDVYSSSSSLVDSSSSSLVDSLSLLYLTSFFLSVDSSFTTMSEKYNLLNLFLIYLSFISFSYFPNFYVSNIFPFLCRIFSSRFIVNIAISGTWSLFTCSSYFVIHTFLYLILVFSFMEVLIMLLQSLAMCP
jgi:hypothetical protein